MKIINIALLIVLPFSVFSQKNKVQGAWRALSDYESTLNDNPDVSYLLKAKESIDLATANEETKNEDSKKKEKVPSIAKVCPIIPPVSSENLAQLVPN